MTLLRSKTLLSIETRKNTGNPAFVFCKTVKGSIVSNVEKYQWNND